MRFEQGIEGIYLMSHSDGCSFFVTIRAPHGLRGMVSTLIGCELPLYGWKSGYNGKMILRADADDALEWSMDSSDNDTMVASGRIFEPVDVAEHKLRSLSACLAAAGFPHTIGLDNEAGQPHVEITSPPQERT